MQISRAGIWVSFVSHFVSASAAMLRTPIGFVRWADSNHTNLYNQDVSACTNRPLDPLTSSC